MGGTRDAAKHIRIECPGVEDGEIDIQAFPNGVQVVLPVPTSGDLDAVSPRTFERDFEFDRKVDGCLALREDECSYDNGVLVLVLKRSRPQRMRLRCAASRTNLLPVAE